jgi:hypothetical protein
MTTVADASRDLPAFTLLGGPLHRLGRRLGLVRPNGNTIPQGLAIAAVLWSVFALFGLVSGRDLLSIDLLGSHVRLLLAIPLMFVAETLVDPRMDAFLRGLLRSRIVSGPAAATLQAQLAQLARLKDSRVAEVVCLALAVSAYWSVPYLDIPGSDHTLRTFAGKQVPPEGLWYSTVCVTMLRFLLLRWIWRLLLWLRCLWCLARLELRLMPAHADGTAGLGGLEVVHVHFAPLVLAISLVLSASFAVDLHSGAMAFEQVYAAAAAILLIDAVVFIAPLLLFLPQLWSTKLKGIDDFMMLAENYANAFDRKWNRASAPNEELLGNADIQTLADLNTAVAIVTDMRVVPVSSKTLVQLAIVAVLPLLPLALFKFPLTQLVGEMISRLTGI